MASVSSSATNSKPTWPVSARSPSRTNAACFPFIPNNYSYIRDTMSDTPKQKLRSQAWFGGDDKDAFIHRSWMKNQGHPNDAFDGRPVIGICNTWSELTPCNGHFRELAEHVKRGILEAGGFPVEFPAMSLGESNLRPTAMLFRNLPRWMSRNRYAPTRSTAWCCW